MKNDVSLSTVTTTKNTQQPTTATHQATASPQPSTSPQILNRTEDKQPSAPPQTSVTNQTSSETVSHGLTLPPGSESPNVTANTTINTTSPGQSTARAEVFFILNQTIVIKATELQSYTAKISKITGCKFTLINLKAAWMLHCHSCLGSQQKVQHNI